MKLRIAIVVALTLTLTICQLHCLAVNPLQEVLASPEQREKFSGFLDNVLRVVPSQDFYAYVDATICDLQEYTPPSLYAALHRNISSIKSSLHLYHMLQSLQKQKDILTAQALEHLGGTLIMQGVLEIGGPAIYANELRKHITINGPIYAVSDQQRFTDRLQAHTFDPRKKFLAYDSFVSLNNYDPITPSQIPDQSLDLVICFIGLHHIPVEKLDAFIASIARIIRPGGVFLLRDHDCFDAATASRASAAHSVFNLIATGETLEAEQAEYRNFQNIHYWINAVVRHGFVVDARMFLQQGDPSRNAMIKFTKMAQNPADEAAIAHHQLQSTTDYERPELQSYLSAPEWINVDVSQAYAEFIEHTPFYQFPYMQSIKTYWYVFAKSWQAAARRKGNLNVALSPSTLMNAFIGATMTAEYTAKALISLPVRLMYQGVEPTTITAIAYDPQHQIGNFDDQAITKERRKNDLVVIELPRYKSLLTALIGMSSSAISLHEIAGQKKIQVKARYKKSIPANFNAIEGCELLYNWQLPTRTEWMYAELCVEVPQLLAVIRELQNQSIELVYVHDF